MRTATWAAFAVVALVVVGSTLAGGHLHKEFLLQRAYDSLGRAAWVRSIRAVGGGHSAGIRPFLFRAMPDVGVLRLNWPRVPVVRVRPVGELRHLAHGAVSRSPPALAEWDVLALRPQPQPLVFIAHTSPLAAARWARAA